MNERMKRMIKVHGIKRRVKVHGNKRRVKVSGIKRRVKVADIQQRKKNGCSSRYEYRSDKKTMHMNPSYIML
jgi:hydrogenase maturation factor